MIDHVYWIVPTAYAIVLLMGILLGILISKADHEHKLREVITSYEAERRNLIREIQGFEKRVEDRFGELGKKVS